ncbi:MAG: Methyltransferase type 11 [Acidimicrobiales bacterium]|nr:Methyltransferase type 11 [Acidimicrobiales bacterium]
MGRGAVLTIVNVEQAAAWDGSEGEHWTANADRYDSAGRRTWQRFLEAQLIAVEDDVLDIGCGTGRSTRDAARAATSGSALGVDLSGPMLELARARTNAEGLTNVRFEQADAQVHPFDEGSVDVVISSFGAMFFNDPVAAFTNIGRAVRPGGRLAVLAWRELARNEWLVAFREALAVGRTLPSPPVGAPGPFGLADADRTREVLATAGFADVAFTEIDEPIEFGTGADDAWGFVRNVGIVEGLTQDLDEVTKARALDQLHATVVAHDTGDGVLFGTSAWLITARRS